MKQKSTVILSVLVGIVVITAITPVMGYSQFSWDNFPETGGFPTDWLEGENEKILQTCQNAQDDGVILRYCQYT